MSDDHLRIDIAATTTPTIQGQPSEPLPEAEKSLNWEDIRWLKSICGKMKVKDCCSCCLWRPRSLAISASLFAEELYPTHAGDSSGSGEEMFHGIGKSRYSEIRATVVFAKDACVWHVFGV